MAKMKAAMAAVMVMEKEGITQAFGVPGAAINPLYAQLRERGHIGHVLARHVEGASHMAEGYTRAQAGNIGVCIGTSGPAGTDMITGLYSAQADSIPILCITGQAPRARLHKEDFQAVDIAAIAKPVTKWATTVTDPAQAGSVVHSAARRSMTPHRGPTFVDFPLDVFGPSAGEVPVPDECVGLGIAPDPDDVQRVVDLVANAERPAFIVGSDVYWDGAWDALRAAVEHLRVPVFFNGLGRGLLPADHELAFLRTRGLLKARADVVVVLGTPLDFRLGFGRFGNARVAHVVDSVEQRAAHIDVHTVSGDSNMVLRALADHTGPRTNHEGWITELRAAEEAGRAADEALLNATDSPIKPSRIYGELSRRLARDAVVVCDGGDFASYAGKFVEVYEPGCWLDTGPYGCLGNGPGYAMAARVVRPSSQVVVMLGDGAAGFSLMDVDTLVRHRLPVVMVVGNNGMWGLEKHPMQAIYGWDMACDLQPGLRYDDVVKALGGAGETVTEADQIGPALDRAFASGVPYMVNVLTDPSDVYPRTSNLG